MQDKGKEIAGDPKAEKGAQAKVEAKGVSISAEAIQANSQALVEGSQKQVGPKAEMSARTTSQLGPVTSAEKSPTSMKTAVSMNTAGIIAGPKPWSKEWVFRAGDEQNPSLKPLFIGKEKPLTDTQAAQIKSEIEELQNLESALKALGIQPELIGVAEQPSVKAVRVQGGEAGTTAQAEIISALGVKELSGEQAGIEKGAGNRLNRDPLAGISGARRNNVPATAASLSGDEFVQTLNGVRTGPVRGQSELSGEETGAQNSKTQGLNSEIRNIGGSPKDRKLSFNDHSLTPAGVQPLWSQDRQAVTVQPPSELTGHVVKGAMSQDRLSSESLMGMSNGIRGIAPQGGGEMRVRLKPDHLGELNIRVTTHGNDVGLRIQASDEHAKKIIEESMTHLKDSLAEQNLSLARVDVVVGKSVAQTSHGDGQMDFNQSRQGGAHSDLLGQNANQGNRNPNSEWVGGNDVTAPVRMGTGKSQAQGAAALASNLTSNSSYRDDGRFDITA